MLNDFTMNDKISIQKKSLLFPSNLLKLTILLHSVRPIKSLKYIYIQTYTHLHPHPYLNISILKKHITYNIWTEKQVDLYVYVQLQFSLLEANSSSDSSSFLLNLLKINEKDKIVFSNSCRQLFQIFDPREEMTELVTLIIC